MKGSAEFLSTRSAGGFARLFWFRARVIPAILSSLSFPVLVLPLLAPWLLYQLQPNRRTS